MSRPHLVHRSPTDERSGRFHLSAALSAAAMNIHVRALVSGPISHSLAQTPRSDTTRSSGDSVLNFRGHHMLLPTAAAPMTLLRQDSDFSTASMLVSIFKKLF